MLFRNILLILDRLLLIPILVPVTHAFVVEHESTLSIQILSILNGCPNSSTYVCCWTEEIVIPINSPGASCGFSLSTQKLPATLYHHESVITILTTNDTIITIICLNVLHWLTKSTTVPFHSCTPFAAEPSRCSQQLRLPKINSRDLWRKDLVKAPAADGCS